MVTGECVFQKTCWIFPQSHC